MRRAFRSVSFVVVVATLTQTGCLNHAEPVSLVGQLAIHPVFRSTQSVPLAEARIRLERNPGGELVTNGTAAISEGDSTVDLSVTVPMRSPDETFLLYIALITPDGDTAYRAGPLVVSPITGNTQPTPIDVVFRFEGTGEIWTTGGDGTLISTIAVETGASTPFTPHGSVQTWAAAFDTDGTLYTLINGFQNAVLATVDLTTGALTTIGGGVGTSMISLEVDDAGTMYGIGYNNGILYQIDKVSGVANAIGTGTGVLVNMDLAYTRAGVLYATTGDNLWTINTATGTSTDLGPIAGVCPGGEIMAVMFDANDLLYATNYADSAASCLMTVNLSTMTATSIGLTGLLRPHGGDIR